MLEIWKNLFPENCKSQAYWIIDPILLICMFIRLCLVATGHRVGRQIQVLKQVHLLSLGITDKIGGGITVRMIVYEQQRSQMMKKMQLLFLVRIGYIHCSPSLIFLSVMLFFFVYNIQYMVQANKIFLT